MLTTADFVTSFIKTLPPSEVEKVKAFCNEIATVNPSQPKRNKRVAEPILHHHQQANIKQFIVNSLAIITPKPQG